MSRAPDGFGGLPSRFARLSASDLLWWSVVVITLPIASAAFWWITERGFNAFAPREYKYRPGTITTYISRALARHASRRRKGAPVRVYMDGCFDMMHYGHANALRQARALGDQLVVGLIPDAEIEAAKGPPVMDEAERAVMVRAVKWVDEVITGVPYDLNPAFLAELFTEHGIDYVVHGDDPCLLPDGTDAYAAAKRQGRFKVIKRTEGVSSTDIVGRMLMCTRDNSRFRQDKEDLARQFSEAGGAGPGAGLVALRDDDGPTAAPSAASVGSDQPAAAERRPKGGSSGDGGGVPGPREPPHGPPPPPPPPTVLSRFMPTSRRIVQFSDGAPAPPGSAVVYIDGAFDLFHPGHVRILQAARAQGDFLLVGLHTDEDVAARRGPHLPLMDVHERALSVLACRHVNEVIIGAPLVVTADLVTTFNIARVVRGNISETGDAEAAMPRYAVPRAQGIFRMLDSPSDMTVATIMHRIVANRAKYVERNARKAKSESAYYQSSKQYVDEV